MSYFTPGEVLGDMRSVATELSVLKNDMDSSDVEVKFKEGLNLFIDEWNSFYEDNSGTLARSLNATRDKVEEYKRRLKDWQERFKAMGFATMSTDLYRAKDPGPGGPMVSLSNKLIIAGSVLVAALLFWPSKSSHH